MDFVGQTRILAVDDDEGSRKLMKAMLAPLGCQVVTASNGAEAVDLVNGGKFDVVLMDIAMPEMDGISALEIIREKYRMEDLPVVMVTGNDDPESRNRALGQRANDFIVKPVEQGELMARLGNILTMHWAKREAEERLKEAEAAHGEAMKMMGSAIHDIKGALTCARGFLGLATEEEDPARLSLPGGHLSKALSAVERAGGMAEEVNNVAAMGRGRLKLHMEEVDIRTLLGKKIGEIRGIAASEGIDLALECEMDSVKVHADRALLEKSVGNLVSGAVRRAGSGGAVSVSLARSGEDCIMVTVEDNGAGASRPFRQRIYDQECQVELQELGLDSPSGIGMSFVRMALENMGVKMWVNSEPGLGTHFSFILSARGARFARPEALKA